MHPTRSFMYRIAASKEIYVLAMNRESGRPDLIDKVPVPGTDKPSPSSMPMAVTPDRRFLYAALRSDGFPVSTLRSTGRAASHAISAPRRSPTAWPISSPIGPGGNSLSASYPGNKPTINPIGDNGLIQEKPTQIILDRPKAHCILVDAANKNVYATSLGADLVMSFKFDPGTGTLSPTGGAGSIPRRVPGRAIWRSTQRALSSDHRDHRHDRRYGVDPATGTLTELHSSMRCRKSSGSLASAADLHVTPDGRFSMAASARPARLPAIASTRTRAILTPIGHFPTEKTPRGFNIDPRGRFLLSVGLDSNAMTVYRIDPQSGALAVAKQYPMGQQPNWIEIVDLR